MKKFVLIIITLFILLISSGCYNYKEINDMAIVSSIGIDKDNKNDKIQTNIFIIYLLIIRKYISIPRIIPKTIYILISPLVYFIITNIIIKPETIQNKISCIYVMKSHVFKTLR